MEDDVIVRIPALAARFASDSQRSRHAKVHEQRLAR
jgi:hypothetical protein